MVGMRQRANPLSLRELASAFPSVSVFHFFLNSNQSCLSPHHHPVISTNTNPTAPAQYPPPFQPPDPLWKSHITLCEKQVLSLGGERINLCSLCGIPDRQIPRGGRKKRRGGYLAHQSSLRSHAAFLTLCWVRINTKYKSRPPDHRAFPLLIPNAATLCVQAV